MEQNIPQSVNSGSSGKGFGLLTFFFILAGAVALYYVYTAITGTVGSTLTTLVATKAPGDTVIPPERLPIIPAPFEGGDYSVNLWVYVNSFNKNRNRAKHIFELKGAYFSSLLIGLGGFKNSLMVRTHTRDPTVSPTGASGAAGAATVGTAGSTLTEGSLAAADVNKIFANLSMQDQLLDAPPMCDLPEIDLQRWVMVTVCLSGRTIDVYMDGKLSRSCVTPSYFRVDPSASGVKPLVCDRDGFDGYVSNLGVANYQMTPDEIYRLYLAGPEGRSTLNIFKWVGSLFTGSQV